MARILVVDDESKVRELVRQVLEPRGHEIVMAEDGDVAVELYRDQPADLVILDIYMPEKAGLETLLELRDEHPETPIVVMSGGAGAFGYDPLETAGHFGVESTLTKPFVPAELVAAVDAALSKR